MKSQTLRRAATVAALAVVAACDPTTAPDASPELDAEAALEDYRAMESAMGSPDLSSFRALEGRTPFGDAPFGVDAMASVTPGGSDDDARAFVLAFAERLIGAAEASTEPARGPIISGWHRGTTFVYDPESDDYQPDLTREGAPETGVRFILYEVDETGTPIVESEIGYADLVDEGDGSVEDIVLRLTAVVHESTLLDYRITLHHDATSGALTVDGFLVGDGVRLDFDVALALSEVDGVGQADLDFELAVDARDFAVVGHVNGIREGREGMGSVALEIRHGSRTLTVDMTGEDGELDGTVLLDGEAFAKVTGPAEDPVISDPNGEPLALSELRILHRIVHVAENVFDLLEDILDPVDELVLLGFVL